MSDTVEMGVPEIRPKEFALIRDFAHSTFGLDLHQGKERLVSARLGKHLLAVDIANGIDPLDVRAHHRVGNDEIVIVFFDTELLEADIAPRELIDPVLYALGITRHLVATPGSSQPIGVPISSV